MGLDLKIISQKRDLYSGWTVEKNISLQRQSKREANNKQKKRNNHKDSLDSRH